MLCAEKHLIPTVKYLLSSPLVGEGLLLLLSLMDILHCPLEGLLHSGYENIDTLNACGVCILNQVDGCTRLITIVQVKWRIPRRRGDAIVHNEFHH